MIKKHRKHKVRRNISHEIVDFYDWKNRQFLSKLKLVPATVEALPDWFVAGCQEIIRKAKNDTV